MRVSAFASALLATSALAQEPAAATDKPVTAPSAPHSIPFALKDNLVTFDALVNGAPQRAVLDSGSGALVVDRTFARQLGLEEGQSVGEAAGAGAQAQQLRPVTLAQLDVGPLRFDRIAGYAVNLEQLSVSAGFPIQVLVGAPAFKHGAVRVDYRQGRVTFGPSGSLGRCAAPIPLTILHDVPVVEAELQPTPNAAPVRLKLIVDLGTRHQAAVVGGAFLRSDTGKVLMAAGTPSQVGHGTGGKVNGSRVRVPELRLGALRFADLDVALSAGVAVVELGVADGTLGVPLWKNGAITFDYPARSLCIER